MDQSDNRFYRERPPKTGALARFLLRRARWYAIAFTLMYCIFWGIDRATGYHGDDHLWMIWWFGLVNFVMGLYGNTEFTRLWNARKQ